MSAFTTTITGTAALDDSLVLAFSNIAYFGAIAEEVVDALAANEPVNGKSVQFSKYADLTVDTSELTELDDLASDAMTDTAVTVTPAEIGQVVTKSRLASFQTGGKINVAAAKAIGRALGLKKDKLGLAALQGASPLASVYPGSVVSAATLVSDAVCDKSFVNKMYNKLSRRNTPVHPQGSGLYVAVAHGDVISDVVESAAAGSWTDVLKYKSPEQVLRNEVGQFGGFTWFRDANCAITSDAAGTIDAYKVLAFGDDVLIRGTSEEPSLRITGPFDKLGRFVNVGFYGIIKYGILDENNLVHGICMSSFGANT